MKAQLAIGNTLPTIHATREQWLLAAVDELATLFKGLAGAYVVPPVRVSVGWPGGRSNKNHVIGQCWARSASADGVQAVFISPVLGDAEVVLATLTHELVHAIDDNKNGHKRPFGVIARGVGLDGPLTATHAGDALKIVLRGILLSLGAYPHAAMTAGGGGKKQTTRMIKCECSTCGYVARTTDKWLTMYGAPICPCGDGRRMDIV